VLVFLRRRGWRGWHGGHRLDAGQGQASRTGATATTSGGVAAEGERWQRELDDDPDREPGTRVGQEQIERVREQLKQLRQGGESKVSSTDPEARFLREHGGRFVLGYTAEVSR